MRFLFINLKNASQQALSKGYPFLEKDCTILYESNIFLKDSAVYSAPRSEWNIRPYETCLFLYAFKNAFVVSSTLCLAEICQPIIFRENKSMTIQR